MRCTNPLFAYQETDVLNDTGEIVVRNKPLKFITFSGNKEKEFEKWKRIQSDVYMKHYNYYQLPCGQCIACRINHSREWGVRCCLEAKKYKYNMYVTMTYADEFLPLNGKGISTLDYADFKSYMDNLRNYCARHYNHRGIRYYGCGEYGSVENTKRPHFHAILFNVPKQLIDDCVFMFMKNGVAYYNSTIMDSCWSRGKGKNKKNLGFVVISTEVNFKNACYVARYCTKKLTGRQSEMYKQMDILPESSRISNRPGIARGYYDEKAQEIYKNDEIFVDSVGRVRPPKYFDTLYNFEDPEYFELIKEKRKLLAQLNEASRSHLTDKGYIEQLADEELINQRKLNRLPRGN